MDDPAARRIWDAALGQLQLRVTRPNYDTWLKDTIGLSLSPEEFVVGTPSDFVSEWLATKMQPVIANTVSALAGTQLSIRFQLLGSNGDGSQPSHDPLPLGAAAAFSPPFSSLISSRLQLNGKLTFERLIVGDCNRMAAACALAAAEHPGESYNPLFLYGAPGLGKTHLLYAIAHRAAAHGHKTVCITSEQFTNEFVTAIAQARGDDFRKKYRSARLLLIDDIQFLSGKERTQEEFLYTFNDLYSNGCHIVITCEQPPRNVPGMDRRLRSRCQMGLAIELRPPSFEVRLAIVKAKACEQKTDIPPQVIEVIAKRNHDSIRELEGSLNRILAYSRLTQAPITPALAIDALDALSPSSSSTPPLPQTVLDCVARYFHFPSHAINSKSRIKPLAEARHIAMYLLRHDAQLTLKEIGRLLGHRDHATVIYGCQKVASSLHDPQVSQNLSEIRSRYSTNPL